MQKMQVPHIALPDLSRVQAESDHLMVNSVSVDGFAVIGSPKQAPKRSPPAQEFLPRQTIPFRVG